MTAQGTAPRCARLPRARRSMTARRTPPPTDIDRGVARTLITDEAGAYNAPSLPPGAYRVRAELTGFKTVERPNVVLEIAKELKIDLTLEPGAVSEKVTVTDEVPLVETSSAV